MATPNAGDPTEEKVATLKKEIAELFDAFDQIANGTLDVR